MTNTKWAKASREYDRAISVLDRAIAYLSLEGSACEYASPEADAIDAAVRILETAASVINATHATSRKQLGIKAYRPYGYKR